MAALYVTLHHAVLTYNGHAVEPRNPKIPFLATLVQGHFAVAIFIILSGFCLMLPVARSSDGQLRGGLKAYICRRAWRILPPYYAALLFSLLLIYFIPLLQIPDATFWHMALPAFTPSVLVSHLLLIHNLNSDWVYKINSPFWSVATEWHIYFIFGLLLLPMWRKFGIAATVIIAFALGLAPHVLLRGTPFTLTWAAPWYIGLFALGMAGAIALVPASRPAWMNSFGKVRGAAGHRAWRLGHLRHRVCS